MSLRVWLPLNGNLENQGLFQLPASPSTSSISYTDGKIGRAASGYCIYHLSSDIVQNKWSLACWCYSSAWGQYNNILLCNNTKDSEDCRFYFSIIGGSSLNIGINGPSSTASFGFQFSTNTWYHVAATYDGTNYALYINGAKVKSGKCTTAIVSNKLNLGIGGRSMNENGTSATGVSTRFNDVRIYDHCLSAKEVKELAKGLVLHYRLAGPGQENLLNGNIHLASAWTQENHTVANYSDSNFTGLKITATQANGRIFNSVSNLWVTNNAKYTVSFWAKSDTAGTTIDCSRSIADFSPTFTLDTNWKYYSGIITTTGTSAGGTLSIRINQASRVVYIANIKVENGAIATPFVPPSNSSIYSAMGYNNSIEYDCSGYRRNGSKSGSITWNIDSPRYTTSYKWPAATSAANRIISPSCTFDGKGITMAVWVKFTGTTAGGGNYHMPLESSTPGYYEMSVDTSGRLRAGIYVNGTRYVENCANPSMYDNKWHHIAITYNGSKICRYVDGKAYVETNVTGTANGLNQAFYIGSYGTSNDYYNNNIWESDARVYTTALSAEDIAELYHSAVKVHNTGKSYAYEYFEAN